ncbi:hypothetical protein A6770_32435 [Nostoc minutum NIES-26]|uniref:Uncharacterized protein n=1 Tax=Nostoc minutum NIES-26 TaxID=1844469 RepID=A0A367Q5Q4_9NOSO|nr:hypothetical protein A6770_32435 [Nostoc minutum NIES-26]
MQPINFINKSLILSLALAVASCQSVGADQTQEISQRTEANTHIQKVRAIAQQYPSLHRVGWKVCGVEKIVSLARSIENQCVESTETMLVWAATGAQKLIPTHQYTGGVQSHLFVESRGCFGVGEPSNDSQFYKSKTFLVGRFRDRDKLPKPTAQIKITQLSQQEKENVIADYISSPPETFIAGISSNYDCQPEQKWREKFARAIPPN